MSNFSIDALLGNVTLSQSRRPDTAEYSTKISAEKDRHQDGSHRERLASDRSAEPNGLREYEDFEELSSDSDVFSEKEYETANRKFYYFELIAFELSLSVRFM